MFTVRLHLSKNVYYVDICIEPGYHSMFAVRLQSRGRTDVGTVEIRLDDGWVQVCDDEWDYADAKVLCKQLGYKDAMYLSSSKLGKMSTNSLANKALTQFSCQGNEKELINCTHNKLTTKCGAMNRAAAICYNKSKSEVDMCKYTAEAVGYSDVNTGTT